MRFPTFNSPTGGVVGAVTSVVPQGRIATKLAIGAKMLGSWFRGSPTNRISARMSLPSARSPSTGIIIILMLAFAVHFFSWSKYGFELGAIHIILQTAIAFMIAFAVTSQQDRSNTLLFLLMSLILMIVASFTFIVPLSALITQFNLPLAPQFFVALILMMILVRLSRTHRFDLALVNFFLIATFIFPFFVQFLDQVFVWMGAGGPMTFVKIIIQIMCLGITPWYWYVVGFQQYTAVPRWISIILIGLVLAILLSFVIRNGNELGLVEAGGTDTTVKEVWYKNFYSAAQNWVGGTKQAVVDFRNKTKNDINSARGIDFEGSVERGVDRSVGLSLDNIQLAQSEVLQHAPAQFLSTLNVNTLDNSVFVTLRCNATNTLDKDGISGTLSKDTYTVRSQESRDVLCTIPNSLKGNGFYELNIGANFDFTTSAFIKRYFAKPGTREILDDQGRDFISSFYSFYEITDTFEKSIHTVAPAELHLDIANPVIELPQTGVYSFLLRAGIKNSNTWEGLITQLHESIISVPKGFSIAVRDDGSIACNSGSIEGEFTILSESDCASGTPYFKNDLNCEDYLHVLFTPTTKGSTAISVGRDRAYTQESIFTCEIDALNPSEILNAGPYSIESFRGRIAYQYDLEKKQSFRVKKTQEAEKLRSQDASVKDRTLCSQEFPVNINTELLFAYDKQTEQEYRDVLARLELDLADSAKSYFAQTNCMSRALLVGLVLNDWSNFKNIQGNINYGTEFGFLGTTMDQVEYVTKNSAGTPISHETFSNMTAYDQQQLVSTNPTQSFIYGALYMNEMITLCSNDPTCAVGKFVCGINFEYGNYDSCANAGLCSLCHDSLLPDVITLATQVEYAK
ncbi:MAG: hypothetical protein ACI8Y7_000314 [Candidatus Woesearchaeota archaeon]|jgi:hypothetical protein